MAKRKRKATSMEDARDFIIGYSNLIDALLQKFTGKTMMDLIKESLRRPAELPPAQNTPIAEPIMPLADAYAILGLNPGAPPEDVKRNYRNLARAFHSDKGSVMNDEAMKLLNRAYERITRGPQT